MFGYDCAARAVHEQICGLQDRLPDEDLVTQDVGIFLRLTALEMEDDSAANTSSDAVAIREYAQGFANNRQIQLPDEIQRNDGPRRAGIHQGINLAGVHVVRFKDSSTYQFLIKGIREPNPRIYFTHLFSLCCGHKGTSSIALNPFARQNPAETPPQPCSTVGAVCDRAALRPIRPFSS